MMCLLGPSCSGRSIFIDGGRLLVDGEHVGYRMHQGCLDEPKPCEVARTS